MIKGITYRDRWRNIRVRRKYWLFISHTLYNLLLAYVLHYSCLNPQHTDEQRGELGTERIQIAHNKQVIVHFSSCTKLWAETRATTTREISKEGNRMVFVVWWGDKGWGQVSTQRLALKNQHNTHSHIFHNEEILLVKPIQGGMFTSDVKPDGLYDLSANNSEQWPLCWKLESDFSELGEKRPSRVEVRG